MKRFFKLGIFVGIIGIAVGLFLTRAQTIDPELISGLTGDPAKGQLVYAAAGCGSCHKGENASGEDALILSGGQAFKTDFGTFFAPNISPDTEFGIGDWTNLQFANAVMKGVSPKGHHYFPAFPYNSYNKAKAQDIIDLKAYMDTLEADKTPSKQHLVSFPFNLRRSVGGWKFLFESDDWMMDDVANAELERGRYLVEALGHCGECHTPRNGLGGWIDTQWLKGARDPSNRFDIPDISTAGLDWSKEEITEYFVTGFTPDFDTPGGHMADVVENIAKLPNEDIQAISAYLKSVN